MVGYPLVVAATSSSPPSVAPEPGEALRRAGNGLARFPLLVGTSCGWNIGGAALTFLPALALTAVPILYGTDSGVLVSLVLLVLITLPFMVYALASIVRAFRSRASDVVLDADGIVIHGGAHHGRRIAWSQLSAPHATIESFVEQRFRLGRLLAGSFLTIASVAVDVLMVAIASKSKSSVRLVWWGSPWERGDIQVHRLEIFFGDESIVVGVTDDETEAESMRAAAESIVAVMEGRHYVEEAPKVDAPIVSCGKCGAPVPPAATAETACPYCGATVAMPTEVQAQAEAAEAMERARPDRRGAVSSLLQQPQAGRINVLLLLLGVIMFAAWPIGWASIGRRVLRDGWQSSDLLLLLAPGGAVLVACMLARRALADRGALQLLTLGFGALAPRRTGEAPRCRRCRGPLATTAPGGVVRCGYCSADNVVGIDLRPTVSAARTEQASLDDALVRRRSEKTKWTALTALSALLLVGWVGGSIVYASTPRDSDAPPISATATPPPVDEQAAVLAALAPTPYVVHVERVTPPSVVASDPSPPSSFGVTAFVKDGDLVFTDLKAPIAGARDLTWTHDGNVLYRIGDDLWFDRFDGRRVLLFSGKAGTRVHGAAEPIGPRIAYDDGRDTLVGPPEGKMRVMLPGVITPEWWRDRIAAIRTTDDAVAVYEADTFHLVGEIPFTERPKLARFSTDGEWLAITVGPDGTTPDDFGDDLWLARTAADRPAIRLTTGRNLGSVLAWRGTDEIDVTVRLGAADQGIHRLRIDLEAAQKAH